MFLSKKITLFCLGLAWLAMNGCATYENMSPAPAQPGAVNIYVDKDELSGGNDLPIGALWVDHMPLVISGHQGNNQGAMMFGLIGLAIADSAGESKAEEKIKQVKAKLDIGIENIFAKTVAEEMKNSSSTGKFIQADKSTKGAALRITPVLLLSYVDDLKAQAFVQLKLGLYDKEETKVWSTRYFASDGRTLPVSGETSWTGDNNKELLKNVNSSMRLLVRTMIKDMTNPYKRDDKDLTSVTGYFPYVKQKLQVVGYKLAEQDDHIVFTPKLGDVIVFTGVNLINKDAVTIAPAKPDDAVFKVIQ